MKFGIVKLYCREDLPADNSDISNTSEVLQSHTLDLMMHGFVSDTQAYCIKANEHLNM